MDKKRDQHYVFQKYLKSWTDNGDNKLWCLRDKKIFKVKPKNIAFEKDFYRIQPLNEKEIEFIKLFFSKYGIEFQKGVDEFLKLYTLLDNYESFFKLLQLRFVRNIPEIDEAVDDINKLIDIGRNNLIEDTYAQFEGDSIKWFDAIKNGNLSLFMLRSNERDEFINFICMQYYRTLRMKNTFLCVLREAEGYFINEQKGSIRAENLVLPMVWLISARCSGALLNAPLTIAFNKTAIPFITSDQPVINLKADYKDLSKETTELVFYYPVSPTIAILLNDKKIKNKLELTNDFEAKKYNDLIARASNKMLFSNIPAVLDEYK